MSFKTIFLICSSALITIVLMQNQDEVLFKILWKEMYVSKLTMMLSLTFVGFIIGFIIRKPKTKAQSKDIPLEINTSESENPSLYNSNRSALSDEDREYIS